MAAADSTRQPSPRAAVVVVGDDGSSGAASALAWAAQYAADIDGRTETCTVDAGTGSSAARGLLDAATAAGADLLVVGRRGSGGFAGLALGSTAHQVVEHAAIPVAIVPSGVTVARPVASHVVVGLDGSSGSARATRWAASFTVVVAARVTAVHAIDVGPALFSSPDADDRYASVVAAAVAKIEAWCQPLQEAGVAFDGVSEEGGAAGVLLHTAADRKADLIVVGRTFRADSMMVMGSTAHRVVAYAPAPVVVVPAEGSATDVTGSG